MHQLARPTSPDQFGRKAGVEYQGVSFGFCCGEARMGLGRQLHLVSRQQLAAAASTWPSSRTLNSPLFSACSTVGNRFPSLGPSLARSRADNP